jgi:putative protein-disulfide isomerase
MAIRTSSATRQGRARASEQRDRVRVDLLTDPFSVWCWGFEPVRRTLELRYPTIDFRFLVGGMFPRLPSPDEMPFSIDRFFAQVQRTTGMPIDPNSMKKDRPESTYPSCIHWHAGRLADASKADAYLRALREAVYIDGLNVSRLAVAADVAQRVGVPGPAFQAALASGQAQEEFDARIQDLTKNGLHGYPTLLISHQGRITRVEGFQTLPSLLGIIESVTGRLHAPTPDPPLEDIVPVGERVATREVAEVLGVSVEQAYDRLEAAVDEAQLEKTRLRHGDIWQRPAAKR